MEIRKRYINDIVILYVAGTIDGNSAMLIEDTGALVRECVQKILCELSNVEMVDYQGLNIIGIAYRNIVNQGGMLKFCSVPAHIKSIFRAARLDNAFEIYDEEEDALRSFDLTSNVDRIPMRRKFKRIDVGILVKYKAGLSANAKFSEGKILNMGGGGFFVHGKTTHPPRTELYMEIYLEPSKKPFVITGQVVWVANKDIQPHLHPGMGIKFVNFDKITQDKIIDFIDKHLTRRSLL